jgi:hypothetical protein
MSTNLDVMKKLIGTLSLLVCSVSFIQAQAQNEGSDTTKLPQNFSLDFSQSSDTLNYILFVFKSDDQYEEVLIPQSKDISNLISPEGIVSIEVFKYDSAVQKYGSRAKNGAVVIHFEKGKLKKLKKDINDKLIDGR